MKQSLYIAFFPVSLKSLIALSCSKVRQRFLVCSFFHQTINSRDNSFLFHNYTSIYATKIELYVNKCSYSRIKSGFPWNYRELSIPLQSLSDKNRKQKQGGTEIIPIPILFTPQSYGIFLVSPSFLTKI